MQIPSKTTKERHGRTGNFEKLVEYIRQNYKSKNAVLVPFLWCKNDPRTVMNLSNIFTKLQIKSRTKERSKLTDDIVDMTNVFIPHKECDKPRVVLIEGNPAMGKTTYCQKLAHDWSVGKIPPDASFPKVEMLLLLKCRDMKTADINKVIDDQLLPQDADEKEKKNFLDFIRSYQSRILLVFDGLDELRQDLLQGFLPLIEGKVFPNMYLMLTARHEAGMGIRQHFDTLLEIVGYTPDDADDYIKKYFAIHCPEDESLASKMIDQLNNDNQLRELTVNPLNTALLCLLYEETGVFPRNQTKLYDDLVLCALKRYFAKKGDPLADDNDLLKKCAVQLSQLGGMAFEALLKDQMYFSQDKMEFLKEDFPQLCFLSREPSVSKIRPMPCYAFTHKTFQEYFAAFYLAHEVLTGDKGNERLLDQLSPFDNWQVWEFLLTMIASKSTEMAVAVVSRLCASVLHHKIPQRFMGADEDLSVGMCTAKPYDWVNLVDDSNLHYSALNLVLDNTLGLIADCEDGENELKDYQTKMAHVVARCFPLTNLNIEPVSETRVCSVYSEYLKFNCTMTHLRVEGRSNPLLLATIEHAFHSNHNLAHFTMWDTTNAGLESGKVNLILIQRIGSFLTKALQLDQLTHLILEHVWISDEGSHVLAEGLHRNRAITHLNLRAAMIFDSGAISLANVLQSNCTLTHLSLPGNWISGIGALALARGLQSNSAVMYLDLSENLGGDLVAMALAQALKSNCALKNLNLSQCYNCTKKATPFADSDNVHVEMIGPLGGFALAGALRSNCTLTSLNLEFNNIGESGAVAIGEALQTNSALTELYLQSNNIGDLGAVALGDALQTNRTLRELYLDRNEIGESGGEALGKALQSNRTLTHLNLHLNGIGDLGAVAVAKALQSNGSLLTRLDLSGNDVSSSGGTAIAEGLQANSSLTHLGFWNNRIGSSGAVAIAKALKSNRTLTHLELGSNGIGDSGAIELAQTLRYYNNTLKYLDLRDDSIGAIGTESLKVLQMAKRGPK